MVTRSLALGAHPALIVAEFLSPYRTKVGFAPKRVPTILHFVSHVLYGMALGAKTARTLLDKNPDRVADPLDYVLALAEAGLAEMRALIFELRPESLETEGLVAALEKQAAALKARHEIEVEAVLCDEPEASLEAKETVYRIAQEALHNTVKHARATNVKISGVCS